MVIYEKSVHEIGGKKVLMAKEDRDYLFSESEELGFSGKRSGEYIKCELTHENAEILRKLFPFTAPKRVLKEKRTFGLGDRLGIATAGHIKLFEGKDVYPVFAQQSIRELNLTHRTYEDVLDCVTFAVFKENYTKGFGADGDHLKTPEDIEYALGLGYSMITLDCSEHIIKDGECETPENIKEKYIGKKFDIGSGITIDFSEEELKKLYSTYRDVLAFVEDMYKRFLSGGKYEADFEISIDETDIPTKPSEHFFIAKELIDAKIDFATIAPRFCGEFQKGIDYIGDLEQFDKEIKIHAQIARHFGYKLSIHSGSDKFSVFPSIARETQGVFHVKTAGTNWLEAMKTVAHINPALYREIHKYALSRFEDAKAFYHVTTNLGNIPPVDTLSDNELVSLFNNNDSRQLIHITYGFILDKYKDELYKLWNDNAEEYEKNLYSHIGKHLSLLGIE